MWSCAFLAFFFMLQRKLGMVFSIGRVRLAKLGLLSYVMASNWLAYVWGVNNGHVVETSLGYFINPLITVLVGVLVLGETLRRAQWWAMGIGAAAVGVLTWDYGRPPWLSFGLASTFAVYGLFKKRLGVHALEALFVESCALLVPAVGYAIYLYYAGTSTFGAGKSHTALFAVSGVLSIVPLACFGAAANRLPLSTLGQMQYLAPVMQFLIGVYVRHEPMSRARWAGFSLVWLCLGMLLVDGALLAKKRHQRRT